MTATPSACSAVDFLDQRPGIDHHAIADDGELAGPHDARGQQRQFVGHAVDDERVAGIVAALEAHHDIGARRQPVDDLAFAFVAPLGADHRNIGHRIATARIPPFVSRVRATTSAANGGRKYIAR